MREATVLTKAPLFGVQTHPGVAGKQNQDAHGLIKLGPGKWADQPAASIYVAVVADGVTGKAGGAKASEVAVQAITSALHSRVQLFAGASAQVVRQLIDEAIMQANNEIRTAARQNPEWGNMSTTLILAMVIGDQLRIAHLGDSRAYLVRGGAIHRLTVDHSWVQDELDQGTMTEEQVKQHPNRNVIQRFLGIRDHVETDHRVVVPPTYEWRLQRSYADSIPLEAGDVILLCSDGQIDNVSAAELLKTIEANRNQPQRAAEKLIALALARREEDNITSVLLTLTDGTGTLSGYRRLAWIAIAVAIVLLFGVVYGLLKLPPSTTGETVPGTPNQVAAAATMTATLPLPTAPPPTVAVAAVVPTLADIATSTETPSPIATATASTTRTPTLQPTATPEPTRMEPTATLQPTATLEPTSTPTATRLPPTRTAAATAASSAASTGTPAVSPTPRAATSTTANLPPGSAITLLGPSNNDSSNSRATFRWQANFTLAENQAFELIFWKPGQDPLQDGLGVVGTTRDTQAAVDLVATNNNLGNKFSPGTYQWGIRVVSISPYTKIAFVSEARNFEYIGSGGSGGSNPGCNPDKETC